MPDVEYEDEFMVFAINDGSRDYYLRLSRFVAQYNVVQLKKMEQEIDGRRVIALGPMTDTIDVHCFMAKAEELDLQIELE